MVLPGLRTLKSLLGNSSRRSNNGRKHKEKTENRDGTEGQGDPIDQRDKGNKAGHQVHPENQTIEKMNTMVAMDTPIPPFLDNKSEEKEDSCRDSFWSTGSSNKLRDNNSSPSPLPPYHNKSEEILPTLQNGDYVTEGLLVINKKEASGQSSAINEREQTTQLLLPINNSNKSCCTWEMMASLKNQNTLVNKAVVSAANSREKCIDESEENDLEKRDPVKESLEKRVMELERLLEEERNKNQCERRLVFSHQEEQERNQRKINEVSHHKLERERCMRQATEERWKEVTAEKDTFKAQLVCLKDEMRKKELVMNNMAQCQSMLEQISQEKSTVHNVYQHKLHDCQMNIIRLEKVNNMLVSEIRNLESVVSSFGQDQSPETRQLNINKVLIERLKYLEEETSSLVMENDQQRMQYEKCLDNVANQVVQALLVQKSLQEECKKLKKRVSDLEQQNQTLHILFQQQLHRSLDSRLNSGGTSFILPDAKISHNFHSLPSTSNTKCNQIEKQFSSTSSTSAICSRNCSQSQNQRASLEYGAHDECCSSKPLASNRNQIHKLEYHQQKPWLLTESVFPMRTRSSSSSSSESTSSSSASSSPSPTPGIHSTISGSQRLVVPESSCGKNRDRLEYGQIVDSGSWKGSCLSCKDDECSRADCCSNCSCGTASETHLVQLRPKESILPQSIMSRERRHVPHGLVMGMTDLLRLNNRKSTELNGWHQYANGRPIKAVSFGPNNTETEFEMGLDSMTTPSDDGAGTVKNFGVVIPNPVVSLSHHHVSLSSQGRFQRLPEKENCSSWNSWTNRVPRTAMRGTIPPKSGFSMDRNLPSCEQSPRFGVYYHHTLPNQSSHIVESEQSLCGICSSRPTSLSSTNVLFAKSADDVGVSKQNLQTCNKNVSLSLPLRENGVTVLPSMQNDIQMKMKQHLLTDSKNMPAFSQNGLKESLSCLVLARKGRTDSLGDESGVESVESSPKDSVMSTSANDDPDETTSKTSATSILSGSKDEGYSTMSSDVQCDGDGGEQSRRASINTSPEFFSFESTAINGEEDKNECKTEISSSATQDKEYCKDDSYKKSCNTVIRCSHDRLVSTKKSSPSTDPESVQSNSIKLKPRSPETNEDSNSKIKSGKFDSRKKNGPTVSFKNLVSPEQSNIFGSQSLLSVKVGHVESIKGIFEPENTKLTKANSFVSRSLNKSSTEKSLEEKRHLCSDSIPMNCSPPQGGDSQAHISSDNRDANVLSLTSNFELTTLRNSQTKPNSRDRERLSASGLCRSKSDSCLLIHNESTEGKSLDYNRFSSNCGPYPFWHSSAWDLTQNVSSSENMALQRSKACLSLTDDNDQQNQPISPFQTAALGWHISFSHTSLNSLHSLCSGSGEASFLHEASTSSKLSSEGSFTAASSDEEASNDEAWFTVDNIDSHQEYSETNQGHLNYNDEEICNWSLNLSSEDICFAQPREDLAWEQQSNNSSHGRLGPPYSIRNPPSDSLPSIQEVDDDNDSYFSLPVNSGLTQSVCGKTSREENPERRFRRKDGACNSWPSTGDYCRGRCRQIHSGRIAFPLHGSESMESWESSMQCTSEGLSRVNSKDLSQLSLDADRLCGDRSASEFASTQTSNSSVNFEPSNAQSANAMEEGESSPVETHFKRDFYRLCKVESCRSLDVSCKNLVTMDAAPREQRDSVQSTEVQEQEGNQQIIRIEFQDDVTDCKIREYAADYEKLDTSLSKDKEDGVDKFETVATVSSVVSIPSKSENMTDNNVTVHETLQELNHMFSNIGEGSEDEDITLNVNCFTQQQNGQSDGDSLAGKEGCTTSWVHFETDVDLSDPKARANLLDSMLASSTSSSDTEVDSDTADEEEYKYQHLHEIHRVRRFKKASDREQCVVRYIPQHRPSILDRKDFYYRYGEKEQEAVASFDFLESMSTSVSDMGSVEILSDKSSLSKDGKNRNETKSVPFENGRNLSKCIKDDNRNYGSLHSLANEADMESRQFIEGRGILYDDFRQEMKFSALTLTSQEGDHDERLSLSDSCAESFSCSSSNLNLEI